jgi:hypothetical protein
MKYIIICNDNKAAVPQCPCLEHIPCFDFKLQRGSLVFLKSQTVTTVICLTWQNLMACLHLWSLWNLSGVLGRKRNWTAAIRNANDSTDFAEPSMKDTPAVMVGDHLPDLPVIPSSHRLEEAPQIRPRSLWKRTYSDVAMSDWSAPSKLQTHKHPDFALSKIWIPWLFHVFHIYILLLL